jgi:hypothetical protein
MCDKPDNIHMQAEKGQDVEKPESPNMDTSACLPGIVSPDDKPTKGEELFLIHLNRFNKKGPTEDDFDHEKPRKRSRSVGEELWEVHIKRSNGLPPDYDPDEPSDHPAALARNAKNSCKGVTTGKPKKQERCSERIAKVMHLRNRDVKKMIA